jgi:hypothetical protein
MNSSLLRRIIRLMREMNYASRRMVELQAPLDQLMPAGGGTSLPDTAP